MSNLHQKKWLILVHQIPPQPNTLRVKIWRRLQQIGAVAIKQSVYAMPLCEQSKEDLSWILKEIIDGGGDGSILEAEFMEGLSDDHICKLFHNARKPDYETLINEANNLLAEWSSKKCAPRDPSMKANAKLSKLKRRLEDIKSIDFFNAPEQTNAELLLKEIGNALVEKNFRKGTSGQGITELKDKIWITRKNLFIDRLACGWLIRRFIDQSAIFRCVESPKYSPKPNEVCFDMPDGDYTHEGELCTFEVMIQRLGLKDESFQFLCEVVHDIDLKDEKYGRSETYGFNAVISGLVTMITDDNERMMEGLKLFDHLHAYYQQKIRV